MSANDQKPCVLIVDDSERSVELMTKKFSVEGFRVLTASGGEKGYNVCKDNPEIDVVLLDFHMPDWDGLETAKEIRELEGFEDVLIIICSAFASKDLRVYGKKIGIFSWVLKPPNFDSLIEQVKKKLNQGGVKKV